jgi:hypothetical protein
MFLSLPMCHKVYWKCDCIFFVPHLLLFAVDLKGIPPTLINLIAERQPLVIAGVRKVQLRTTKARGNFSFLGAHRQENN